MGTEMVRAPMRVDVAQGPESHSSACPSTPQPDEPSYTNSVSAKQASPAHPTLNFGLPTFNAAKTKSTIPSTVNSRWRLIMLG